MHYRLLKVVGVLYQQSIAFLCDNYVKKKKKTDWVDDYYLVNVAEHGIS